jgi:polyisoprenoid-binding protein YceI
MFENYVMYDMKKSPLFIIFLFLTTCAIAQIKHTLTKSAITFQIKNLGINTSGNIGGVQANILFDPANLGASTIDASADVNTLNTDNNMRDEHLKSDSYFDAATYPKISMKSVSFKHKSGDNYVGQFNVTIKNKTQVMDVPFTYSASANTASFKGSFKLKRTDFGIGGSSLVMSNEVTITIDVETSK